MYYCYCFEYSNGEKIIGFRYIRAGISKAIDFIYSTADEMIPNYSRFTVKKHVFAICREEPTSEQLENLYKNRVAGFTKIVL